MLAVFWQTMSPYFVYTKNRLIPLLRIPLKVWLYGYR